MQTSMNSVGIRGTGTANPIALVRIVPADPNAPGLPAPIEAQRRCLAGRLTALGATFSVQTTATALWRLIAALIARRAAAGIRTRIERVPARPRLNPTALTRSDLARPAIPIVAVTVARHAAGQRTVAATTRAALRSRVGPASCTPRGPTATGTGVVDGLDGSVGPSAGLVSAPTASQTKAMVVPAPCSRSSAASGRPLGCHVKAVAVGLTRHEAAEVDSGPGQPARLARVDRPRRRPRRHVGHHELEDARQAGHDRGVDEVARGQAKHAGAIAGVGDRHLAAARGARDHAGGDRHRLAARLATIDSK